MAPPIPDDAAKVAYCALLEPNPARHTLFPVHDDEVYDYYKRAVASFWTPAEVDLTTDTKHWELLKDDERHFIKHVLAFFAASDGIVNENLCLRFSNEVQLAEARAFYSMQNAMETIHSETYSLLIETLVGDTAEKALLFSAARSVPAIRAKAEWAQRWIESSASFGERLVAFACVEVRAASRGTARCGRGAGGTDVLRTGAFMFPSGCEASGGKPPHPQRALRAACPAGGSARFPKKQPR